MKPGPEITPDIQKRIITPTENLDAHARLGRAFRLWSKGVAPDAAKTVGDVIPSMIRVESLSHHKALSPEEVWERRIQRAGWLANDATFEITDAMRASVGHEYVSGQYGDATEDDVFLMVIPPYTPELAGYFNALKQGNSDA